MLKPPAMSVEIQARAPGPYCHHWYLNRQRFQMRRVYEIIAGIRDDFMATVATELYLMLARGQWRPAVVLRDGDILRVYAGDRYVQFARVNGQWLLR